MLGIASLGFLINDAKAGRDFDKMIALILMGSIIVILGIFFLTGSEKIGFEQA